MRSLIEEGNNGVSDNRVAHDMAGGIGKPEGQHDNSTMSQTKDASAHSTRGMRKMNHLHLKRPSWLTAAMELPTPSRKFAITIAIPAFIALAVSGYLAVTSLSSSSVAGCSGSLFDCESVLKSRWSTWMGIPVSALAFLTYVGVLVALLFTQFGSRQRQQLMWLIVTTLCLSAGAAAVWFIFLQVFVLKHLCWYCLAAHSCGLFLTVTVLSREPLGKHTGRIPAMAACVGILVLISGQWWGPAPKTYTIETYESVSAPVENMDGELFGAPNDVENSMEGEFAPPEDDFIFEPPAEVEVSQKSFRFPNLNGMTIPVSTTLSSMVTFQPQESAGDQSDDSAETKKEETKSEQKAKAKKPRRLASISNGRIKLDVNRWPIIGDPDAKFVFVELFDYACPHCRQTHQKAIKGAKARLNGDLAVITLPLPLNTKCNKAIVNTGPKFTESCEVSNLAVAMWRVDPKKFEEFHDWMFNGDTPPSYAQAKAHAETLVDSEKLAQVLASKVPSGYVQRHVQIYEMTGKGDVPKLMFPGTAVIGELTSADVLVEIIQRQGPTPQPSN